MRSNFLLILEIAIAILLIYYLLTFEPNIHYSLRGAREEDLLASLISINYLNLSNTTQLGNITCSIVSNIFEYYKVYVNGSLVCNSTNKVLNNSFKLFYIVNNSPVYVDLFIK